MREFLLESQNKKNDIIDHEKENDINVNSLTQKSKDQILIESEDISKKHSLDNVFIQDEFWNFFNAMEVCQSIKYFKY